VITPETKVRDPNRLVIEDQYVAGRLYTFPNSTSRDNGQLSVSDALKVSSNVFFMSVAGGNKGPQVKNLKPDEQNIEGGLGISGLAEGLGWFGFGQTTGTDWPAS
jgi:penicillin-binding protein 2